MLLDFKSKKIRVNLNLPIKAEVKAESADVLKAVDEDRKYVIQATIVRYETVHVFEGVLTKLLSFISSEQHHEGTQDYQESGLDSGSYLANLTTICTQDS